MPVHPPQPRFHTAPTAESIASGRAAQRASR